MVRDDRDGGLPADGEQDDYVLLRIALWHWRLRLGGATVCGVFLVEGMSVGLVFVSAVALVATGEVVARRLAHRSVARRQVRPR